SRPGSPAPPRACRGHTARSSGRAPTSLLPRCGARLQLDDADAHRGRGAEAADLTGSEKEADEAPRAVGPGRGITAVIGNLQHETARARVAVSDLVMVRIQLVTGIVAAQEDAILGAVLERFPGEPGLLPVRRGDGLAGDHQREHEGSSRHNADPACA